MRNIRNLVTFFGKRRMDFFSFFFLFLCVWLCSESTETEDRNEISSVIDNLMIENETWTVLFNNDNDDEKIDKREEHAEEQNESFFDKSMSDKLFLEENINMDMEENENKVNRGFIRKIKIINKKTVAPKTVKNRKNTEKNEASIIKKKNENKEEELTDKEEKKKKPVARKKKVDDNKKTVEKPKTSEKKPTTKRKNIVEEKPTTKRKKIEEEKPTTKRKNIRKGKTTVKRKNIGEEKAAAKKKKIEEEKPTVKRKNTGDEKPTTKRKRIEKEKPAIKRKKMNEEESTVKQKKTNEEEPIVKQKKTNEEEPIVKQKKMSKKTGVSRQTKMNEDKKAKTKMKEEKKKSQEKIPSKELLEIKEISGEKKKPMKKTIKKKEENEKIRKGKKKSVESETEKINEDTVFTFQKENIKFNETLNREEENINMSCFIQEKNVDEGSDMMLTQNKYVTQKKELTDNPTFNEMSFFVPSPLEECINDNKEKPLGNTKDLESNKSNIWECSKGNGINLILKRQKQSINNESYKNDISYQENMSHTEIDSTIQQTNSINEKDLQDTLHEKSPNENSNDNLLSIFNLEIIDIKNSSFKEVPKTSYENKSSQEETLCASESLIDKDKNEKMMNDGLPNSDTLSDYSLDLSVTDDDEGTGTNENENGNADKNIERNIITSESFNKENIARVTKAICDIAKKNNFDDKSIEVLKNQFLHYVTSSSKGSSKIQSMQFGKLRCPIKITLCLIEMNKKYFKNIDNCNSISEMLDSLEMLRLYISLLLPFSHRLFNQEIRNFKRKIDRKKLLIKDLTPDMNGLKKYARELSITGNELSFTLSNESFESMLSIMKYILSIKDFSDGDEYFTHSKDIHSLQKIFEKLNIKFSRLFYLIADLKNIDVTDFKSRYIVEKESGCIHLLNDFIKTIQLTKENILHKIQMKCKGELELQEVMYYTMGNLLLKRICIKPSENLETQVLTTSLISFLGYLETIMNLSQFLNFPEKQDNLEKIDSKATEIRMKSLLHLVMAYIRLQFVLAQVEFLRKIIVRIFSYCDFYINAGSDKIESLFIRKRIQEITLAKTIIHVGMHVLSDFVRYKKCVERLNELYSRPKIINKKMEQLKPCIHILRNRNIRNKETEKENALKVFKEILRLYEETFAEAAKINYEAWEATF